MADSPDATPLGRVVTLGAHVLDVLALPVESLPDEDAAVVIDQVRMTVAGTAGAVAVDLARLGAEVTTIGAVGLDGPGAFLLSLLEDEHVASSVVQRPGLSTAVSVIPVSASGAHATWHARGAINTLTIDDIDLDLIDSADVLHVGGPDALGRFAGDPLIGVLRRARAAGTITTMDLLGPARDVTLDRLRPVLGLIDHAMPNRAQVAGLTGHSAPAAGAAALRELGIGTVHVTLGGDGSLVCDESGATKVPAVVVDVVDTTGSGDGYSAGVIAGMLLGWTPVQSACLGAAVGGLIASGLGSEAGLTDPARAISLARAHARHTGIELPELPAL